MENIDTCIPICMSEIDRQTDREKSQKMKHKKMNAQVDAQFLCIPSQ